MEKQKAAYFLPGKSTILKYYLYGFHGSTQQTNKTVVWGLLIKML
jgi:hypothetical protein